MSSGSKQIGEDTFSTPIIAGMTIDIPLHNAQIVSAVIRRGDSEEKQAIKIQPHTRETYDIYRERRFLSKVVQILNSPSSKEEKRTLMEEHKRTNLQEHFTPTMKSIYDANFATLQERVSENIVNNAHSVNQVASQQRSFTEPSRR